jgi:flagellar biosynthesis/type III secretory pathway M-ring protein FliF/YscJ
MIQALLVLVLVLVAACAVSVLVAKAQAKRAAKAEAEAKRLHDAFWEVEQRAERLQKALNGNLKAEEEADEKRKDLAATADSDLAGRANGLFGVRDGKKRS